MTNIYKDEKYVSLYQWSVQDPDNFWAEQAGYFIEWMQPWDEVRKESTDKTHAKWFINGKLNIASNCLDKHLIKRGDKAAIIWEGDDPSDKKTITYRALHKEECSN